MGLGQGPQGPFHPLLTPDPCPATRLSPLPPDLDNGWSEASSQDLQWLQFTTMDPEQMALLQSCAMVIQFPQSQWQLQKVLVLGVPGPQNVYKKKYREIVKSIAPSTRRYPRSKSTRISDDSFHHQAVGFSGPSLTTIIHPFGIQATLTLQSSGLDGRPGVDHHSKQQQSSPMEEPHWNPLEYHHQQSNLSNHWIP